MCFYIHKDYPKAMIAKKDIKVYKTLMRDGADYIAPVYPMIYKAGKLYKASMVKIKPDDYSEQEVINEGLHSFSTFTAGLYEAQGRKLFLFIIPKGSKYYYNSDCEEYVSNKIIWTGKIWRTDRWIIAPKDASTVSDKCYIRNKI